MTRTELTLDDLSRLLSPFDLRPRKVRALEAGTINSNFRVDTDGGPVFVRVNEGKSEADVRFEAALLWHLGARRFPTPQPLRRGDGRPYELLGTRCVSVFPWVQGAPLDEARISADHAGRLGVALAELHQAATGFRERRAGIYTFDKIAERIERVRSEPTVAGALPILDEESAWLRAARANELPSGIIHADLFPDNVLFRGGAIAALLDFEQACVGPFAFDLAVALLAWCWSTTAGDFDERRTRALVAGYQHRRPLSASERDALWPEARFAALRFTVTRITDVHLAGLEREGKDFRDYLARLLRLRELGEARFHALLEAPPRPASDGEAAART